MPRKKKKSRGNAGPRSGVIYYHTAVRIAWVLNSIFSFAAVVALHRQAIRREASTLFPGVLHTLAITQIPGFKQISACMFF